MKLEYAKKHLSDIEAYVDLCDATEEEREWLKKNIRALASMCVVYTKRELMNEINNSPDPFNFI